MTDVNDVPDDTPAAPADAELETTRSRIEDAGPVARFAHLVVTEPVKVVAAAAIISLIAAGYALFHLRIDTNRDKVIGDLPYNQRFRDLEAEFGDLGAMTVVVKAGAAPIAEPQRRAARAFADALGVELAKDRRHFGAVFDRVPEDALRGRALLFLDKRDLDQIASELSDLRVSLARLAGPDGVGGFFDGLAAHVKKLIEDGVSQQNTQGPDPEDRGRFLHAVLDGVTDSIERGAPYETPWKGMLPTAVLKDGYTWTADDRLIILVGLPHDGAPADECVHALKDAVARIAPAHPAVTVGLTGDPVLSTDEMETYGRDARTAVLAAIFGVTLLLMISYRRVAAPLLIVTCLLMAVALTLAFAAIWPGYLNLFSIVFLVVLVGFGIDFGIQLVSRYDEERTYGMDAAAALEAALRLTGRACAAGAITTAIALASMACVDSIEGLRQFGVIAAVGTLFCLVAMVGALPALVVIADRGRAGRMRRPRPGWARTKIAVRLDALAELRPARVIGGAAVVAALALAAGAEWMRFDGDLLSLQARGLESVELATDLLKTKGETAMFAAVVAKDESEVRAMRERLERLPEVDRVGSIEQVMPSDQQEKLAAIRRIDELCAAIPGVAPQPGGAGSPRESGPGKKECHARDRLLGLVSGLRAFDGALELAQNAMFGDGARTKEFHEVQVLRDKTQALIAATDPARLDDAQLEERAKRLVRYERPLRHELQDALARLKEEGSVDRAITTADLPSDIRERFIGKHGRLLVRVYPKENVFEDEPLARFVSAVRGVVPDVTGIPLQIYETSRRMRDGYEAAAKWALLLIALYLIAHFKNLARAAIALAALMLGAVASFGVLALIGQSMNPANMLAIPLTLGIGVSYAIQLVHRHRQAHAVKSVGGVPALIATSTGRGVVLSAATNVVGFGALALAHHRGTMSIGIAITIGVLGCLAAALVFLPALLRAWTGPTHAPSLTGNVGPKVGPEGRAAHFVDGANSA